MAPLEIEFRAEYPFPLIQTTPGPCPYLPEREMRLLIAIGDVARAYRALLDHGFRRTGEVYYRTDCPGCAACVPIRVPVARFRPSRSQRRVLRRNHDLEIASGEQRGDDEHYDLFRRYQLARHEGQMLGERAEFDEFLCHSTIASFELAIRLGGRLVVVSVVDAFDDALSSIYSYYDPDLPRRSLGVFSGLAEIAECAQRGLAFWYLGFHVAGCRKMEYKSCYRPYELLQPDGSWRRFADDGAGGTEVDRE